MPRPRTVAIVTLLLALALTPLLPGGEDEDGAIAPSGGTEGPDQPATAGLTPALEAEIDRVVAEGRSLGRMSGKVAPEGLADLVRCADFSGQRYCLHTGWTEDDQATVQQRMATAARSIAARSTATGTTGDLDVLATLRRAAALDPDERAAMERAELTDAARSVDKVWELRHAIQGVPLPTGQPVLPRAQEDKRLPDYPRRHTVLRRTQVSEQKRSYWCGPTTMQMIAWGWKDRRQRQRHWADKLGTTGEGTAISEIVRVINRSTGWDREKYAGRYITLDISDWKYHKWLLLQMRHLVDYRAPVVLHPVLLKRYFPYLDDDASGHFQVGRGYDKRGPRPTQLGFFEPWNQQRFDPSEPYISRVQWRSAYRSYRANRAHYQQNIGV